MSNMSGETAQERPTKPRSRRREIVDILEHCYGPLLLSIGFGVFLTLDAAREVMVVFASEIVLLLSEFGTYAAGLPVLVAIIAAVLAAGALSGGKITAAKDRKDYLRQAVFGGSLAIVIIVLVTLAFSLIPPAWQNIVNVPGRVLLGMFAFFYVPVVLWWAMGYTLKAEQGDIDSHVFDETSIREGSVSAVLLIICGRIPLVLAGYALFTEGFGGLVNWIAGRPVESPVDLPGNMWGQEAEKGTALTLVVLSVIVIGVAAIRWVRPNLNKKAIGGSIRTAPFGAAFVGVFVLISFVFSPTDLFRRVFA